jgi:hypothetical protein
MGRSALLVFTIGQQWRIPSYKREYTVASIPFRFSTTKSPVVLWQHTPKLSTSLTIARRPGTQILQITANGISCGKHCEDLPLVPDPGCSVLPFSTPRNVSLPTSRAMQMGIHEPRERLEASTPKRYQFLSV